MDNERILKTLRNHASFYFVFCIFGTKYMTWVKVKKKKYENIMMETPFSSILFAIFLNSEDESRFSVSVRRSVASHYHFYSFYYNCRLFILRNPCIMSSRIKLESFLSLVTHLFFPLSLSVYLFDCPFTCLNVCLSLSVFIAVLWTVCTCF